MLFCKAGDAAEWSFQRARLPKATHTVPQHRWEAWTGEWERTGVVEIEIGQSLQLFGFAMIFFMGGLKQ